MLAVKGTVRNGSVVLDDPDGLAEGTRVEVVPEETARPSYGLREEDWPTTPEGVAALAQRMREVEPLEMTVEEEADLAQWRAKQKEYVRSKWEDRSRRVEEAFE